MNIAQALRALLALQDANEYDQHSGVIVSHDSDLAAAMEAATDALAAHDAAVSAGGWRVRMQAGERCIVDDAGTVAVVFGDDAHEAARIVACVNACTGIADPGAMVAAFLDLSSYVGGHDERPGHPCRVASDILAPLRGAR